MNRLFRKNNGFTTADLALAMVIIIIFTSIMASIMYSLYISTNEARRTATAVNYAVDIFEKIGGMAYINVTGTNVLASISEAKDIKIVNENEVTATIRNI